MTWTATERLRVGWGNWRVIDIADEQGQHICRLKEHLPDPAAIEQMRARARLIVQAEAMAKHMPLLLATAEQFEKQAGKGSGGRRGGPVFEKARAIIKATEGDHG